jgi:hypothetical protein
VTEQGPGTRTGASTPDRRLPVVALGVAVLCTLLMAAFALIGMRPDGSSQAPLEGRIDKLYSHALGLAMFEREYGVVQQHLQDYQAEGLIERAVVADRSGAVIAAISPPDSARVGDRLGNDLPGGARRVEIRLRDTVFGQLYVWQPALPPPTGADKPVPGLSRSWMAGGSLLALLGAVLLGIYLRQFRNR